MAKIDYKKELKHLYSPPDGKVVMVDVPRMNFLMVDGVGNPNAAKGFQDAVELLYGVSYALKFMIKKEKLAVDYTVMPFEGLWWTDDMSEFSMTNKDIWKWTLMIMQPPVVTEEMLKDTLGGSKKRQHLSVQSKIKFSDFEEGLSAQIMHIGPYSAEGQTVQKLHSYIRGEGYLLTGKHHEIYLTDPRRVSPEKMKTVIRQPVGK